MHYLAQPHLTSGRLVAVLPQLISPVVPLSVIYPQNRHLPSTIRAFVDWLAARLQTLDTARSTALAPP